MCYLEERDPAAQYVSEALCFHYCFVINFKAAQIAGLPEGKGSNNQIASILRAGKKPSLIPTLSMVATKSSRHSEE